MHVLVVCTANQCRSPMAAGLLQARLAERHVAAVVSSAGFGPPGAPAVDDAVDVMADVGIDLRQHRSTEMSVERLDAADLVVVMTRQHAIDTVLVGPAAWPRTFLLVDLVRRGRRVGPAGPTETTQAWVARAHGGRQRRELLALGAGDDITDPLGQGRSAFRACRDRLDGLVGDLVDLLAPDRPAVL